MKRNTPLITLLTGAALGVVLLIASMLSTPSKTPAGYTATASPTAASVAPATTAPASTAAPPSATAPSSAPPTSTATAYASAPAQANYAGKVQGGGASVAISIHGSQAIAYVCNGSTVEAWLKGTTASGGKLVMTGKNHARLTVAYGSGQVTGDVVAHDTHYSFAVHAVNKPSGLYEATAVVRGATIKAGWIVLPDGTQVGSLESDANSSAPSATAAPELDVATGTAVFDGVVLHAIPVSGFTGSGF